MLGWFKKTFGKKETSSGAESISTETSFEESPALPGDDQDAASALPRTESSREQDSPALTDGEASILAETIEGQAVSPREAISTEPKIVSDAPQSSQQENALSNDSGNILEGQRETFIEREAQDTPDEEEKNTEQSMFRRLQKRLGKTRDSFIYRLDALFLGKKEIDQELFNDLEEILITADLGVNTTLDLLDEARKRVKRDKLGDPQELTAILHQQLLAYIETADAPAELVMPEQGPFVIMVVGVNGVGKTTTIGKIAAKFIQSERSVLLVAADTFRAAAINQLRIWGDRVGAQVIAQHPGADPSSVVFDGLEYGMSHNFDVILIDTAGRLHTSVNLMEELKKIKRVINRKLPGAPHEILLVLDATTGQNGIAQARLFHDAVNISGLALTKLDGTAKGGIVANICRELAIPVRFIGIGEQIDDLRDFNSREFVDALFAKDSSSL